MPLKRHRLAQRRKTVGHSQESLAEKLSVDRTTVVRWERGESAPQPWVRLKLAEVLEITVDQLNDLLSEPKQVDGPSSKPLRIGQDGNATVSLVSDATDSVANDPLLLAAPMPRESIESLQDDVRVLARTFSMTALDVFTSARRLRDEARALAERARRPSDLADLYAVIGQGTALMASTAFDLGHWNDSAALARTAAQYADLAGQASLMAWTIGLQMTLANWRNEPDAALAYFARAMRIAPDGEPKLRLHHIAARSHALLGDSASATQVLQAARRSGDLAADHPDDLSVSLGGEFAFGPARAAACAAATWLDLGNGQEAAKYAQEALDAYEELPSARRPSSQIKGVRVDLAAAHLFMGDKDSASDALDTVLHLPPQKRNASLTGRMARMQRLLTAPPWKHDQEGRRLAEEISAWLTEQPVAPIT